VGDDTLLAAEAAFLGAPCGQEHKTHATGVSPLSVALGSLAWGLDVDATVAREWLRLGAVSVEEWLNPALSDLPGRPQLGTFNYDFAVGVIGGSLGVRGFVADPVSFGEWSAGTWGDDAFGLLLVRQLVDIEGW